MAGKSGVRAGVGRAGYRGAGGRRGLHPQGRAEDRHAVFHRQERRRLDPGHGRGAGEDREGTGYEDPVRGKRAGDRLGHPPGRRALHQARRQHRHRHRLRLFRHLQATGRAVSRGGLPQRLGHHQRAQPGILLWPHLRKPVPLWHGRGRGVQDRQAGLRRRQSLRRGELDHQRLRAGRPADESQCHPHGDLHRQLERSGQGARRRRGADRPGRDASASTWIPPRRRSRPGA